MFSILKRKPPFEPPTQRQINYAKRLGIGTNSKMSKSDVSEAISKAEAANPKAKRQREHVNAAIDAAEEKKWRQECGEELIKAEEEWSRFADDVEYMLAIYQRGKQTIVDVLRVNDAFIDGIKKKKLRLMVAAPKVVKDRYIGEYLEWERDFNLATEKLLHYEALHSKFPDDGIPAYKKTIKSGLKIAKKL